MKTALIILFLSGVLLINTGCKKDSNVSESGNNNTPPTDTAQGGGPVITDPALLILGKWQVIKDSIVVHNFAFSDGTVPMPGVYYGTVNDHWLFQTNGTVYIYEGVAVGTTPYQLVSATSLLIPAFAWGDVTIVTLNSKNFAWEKSLTGSNGGTYYRKAYFKK